MECRYPVFVERFSVRRGSGGVGQYNGGESGLPGHQHLVRADGTITELAPTDGADVQTGDRLVLQTPGGGGWGKRASAP